MENHLLEIFTKSPLFLTERIMVKPWQVHEDLHSSRQNLMVELKEVLSPDVIKDLPDSWLDLITEEKLDVWLEEQKRESHLFAILPRNNDELLGLLFLSSEIEEANKNAINLRLGYLLKESVWGKGIASELIAALLEWCVSFPMIQSISGGVVENNIASIKVIEKNGFVKSNQEMPPGVLLYTYHFDIAK